MNKRYEEYKTSGIDWLGNVPNHWVVTIISRLCNMGRGRVINHEYIHEHPGIYPIYSSQTADNGVMGLIDTYDFDGEYVTWTTDGANAGTVSYREGKFNCTNVCGTLSAKEQNIYLKFLPYILNLGTKYSVRFDINPKLMNGMMGRIPVCVPPLKEQRTIVRFLDDKTTQIDQLIAQKQQMLELLQEERAALINHAVTKGPDAAAPLRDSGVEWLGEVPAHWEVKRLKHLAVKIGSGVTPRGGAEVYQQSGVPILRSQNIHFDGLRLDDVAYVDEAVHESMNNSKVRPGDVLLNITGASIGRCYFADETLGEANVNQHVCIVRPNKEITTRFLWAVLSAELGQEQIEISQNGSGREGLNFENLKKFVVGLPPLEEQEAITDFLAQENLRIAEVVDTINQEIALLQEYRAALIAEAVTGQIDVRDYEPVAQEILL